MSAATKVLAILLAVSVGLNLLAGRAYLGQRDKAVTHQVREGTAVATAELCGKGTEALGEAAGQRERDAAPARKAAVDRDRQHQARAQQILSKAPAVPGNACASAEAVLDGWWADRAKP